MKLLKDIDSKKDGEKIIESIRTFKRMELVNDTSSNSNHSLNSQKPLHNIRAWASTSPAFQHNKEE